MSDEQRNSPVHAALNHIPTLCGIKKMYFVGICGVTMALFIGSKQTLLSILSGLAAYIVLYMISRNEPEYINLYLAAVTLPTTYDPGKYTASKVRES